jgi:hypothetical protein
MKGRVRDAVGCGEGKGYPLPNRIILQIVLFPLFYVSGFLARKEAPYAKNKTDNFDQKPLLRPSLYVSRQYISN